MIDELLSQDEHDAIRLLGEFATLMVRIVGTDTTRPGDWAEMVSHIHVLQQMVMAQAAARAYPTRYRLLGGTLNRSAVQP